ncbi:TonB-dependent receptor [Parasphingorhabdus sp.]|uniref:TonB-dependent receptor domain-containing protein n=1 Tax=Parasphingorhabdus sp. TaxID=2709688 RepID=UPI0030B1DFC2
MKTYSFLKASAAPAVLGLALLAAPAYAQDQVADGSRAVIDQSGFIVVTGSRIARRNLESAAPIAVVSDEEFKLSGTVNVENVINTLPQVVPGTTSFSNNPGGGVATLNLRGLGSARSLVLVNGRRQMFFDTSQVVDLNTIPSFLIDSVDVVTGGASAVYGSDAVAGVVNFRLKQDLEGVIAGGQYGLTEEGDGSRYNAYVAIGGGFDDDRGHATVYAEYYNRSEIYQGARSYTNSVLGDDGSGGFVPGGSSTLPSGVIRYFGDGDTTGTDFDENGAVVFDEPGNFRARNGDLYNYGPANYLQVPQERYLMGGFADYEFSEGHTVYAEVSFVNNRVPNELAATPVTGSFAVNLPSIQSFLTPADYAQLVQLEATETTDAGDDNIELFLQRRVVETGGRNTLDERSAFRTLLGFRGDITDNLSYDAYYSYARTRNGNIQSGNVSRSAFSAGLDGTGTAINVFGPGTLTATAVDQISILAQNTDISVLQVVSGAINGTLGNFGMGADDIGFAVGVEYRKMASEFIPDTALSSGDVIGFNGGLPTSGSYDVKEVFAELRVPLLGPDSGIHRLEANGAARYSDYSLASVGGVWTYAGGVEFAPIPDITFRGQYQSAVRAPNVGELFGGQSQGFPGATDPCAVPANATDATIRALCVATGVPSGSSALFTTGLQLNTQIQGLFGGNADLQEEKSTSYTFGAILQPSFVPGLSLTVDYFNIEVTGAISVLGGGLANSLNLCYNVIQDINSPYCQVFANARNAAGILDDTNPAQILAANTAKLAVEGIDLEVNYSTPIGLSLTGAGESRLNFNFLGTYTKTNAFTPVEDLPNEVNECAGKFGQLACGNPTPKYKWTSRVSFIDGPLTTSLRWRHMSSVTDDDADVDYSTERLPAYNLFDLSFALDVNDNLTLSMGANNLLNKKPFTIGDNQEQANTYPSTYDVLGRDYFVSAAIKF